MQIINVLVVFIKDTDKAILTKLLAKLDYSFLTVEQDASSIHKLLSDYSVESILLPFDLIYSKEGTNLATYLNRQATLSCIYYSATIHRKMLHEIRKIPPPIYLCQLSNQDDLYVHIELARYYSLFNTEQVPISAKNYFFIKQNQDYLKLNFEDISYIMSEHIYLRIFSSNAKSYLIRDNLSRLIVALPNTFLRCHRSYIINLEYVYSIHPKKIILTNNKEIPVTPKYRKDLLKIITPTAFTKPRT